jgi:hypothetical protein
MSAGEDGTHVRLLKQVPLDPANEEVLLAHDREIPGAYGQQANVGAANGSGELDAGIDRHFHPAQQTDLTAEERIDVGAGGGNAARWLGAGTCKAEDTGPLQEK